MLTPLETNELITITKGMSKEQRKIVIDNLPVDELLDSVKERYSLIEVKLREICDISSLIVSER